MFGEHIINKGAHGLAIPYNKMYCQLSFDNSETNFYKESNHILKALAEYILNNNNLKGIYNTTELLNDVNNGLGFCMNIPIGYGLGSSGALIAAIYDNYKRNDANNISNLRSILGETESFFHGKSSGLDPLVSYLNKTIVIKDKPIVVEQEINWRDAFSIYLLDTETPRKTGPLVENFLNKYDTDSQFANVVDIEIIPLNNAIIADFLNDKYDINKIKKLSKFQLENYQSLTLVAYKELWQKSLKNDEFYIKICGAGGGGYFLIFSRYNDLAIIENHKSIKL